MSEILTRHDTGQSESGLTISPLQRVLDGDVAAPGAADWDEARLAWNLAIHQNPAAVVLAESAADVAATVAFARAHGLRVASQGTGHNASALGASPTRSSWRRTACGGSRSTRRTGSPARKPA